LDEKILDFQMVGLRVLNHPFENREFFHLINLRPRDRPKKTWEWGYRRDRQTRQICKENAVDQRKWRKL